MGKSEPVRSKEEQYCKERGEWMIEKRNYRLICDAAADDIKSVAYNQNK